MPPPRPPSGGNALGLLLILGVTGLAVIVAIVGLVVFGGDDDDPPRPLANRSYTYSPPSVSPSYSPYSPSARPSTRTGGKPNLTSSFFASSVKTSSGTYTKAWWDTRTCGGMAKSSLQSILRGSPCKGSAYMAQYRAPDRQIYIQMTLMEFSSESDAKRVANSISAKVSPRIEVSRGTEPGNWTSSSWVGNHVLVRQSFRSGSSQPGSRTGTVQTYGDALIRMLHAELKNVYLWSN